MVCGKRLVLPWLQWLLMSAAFSGAAVGCSSHEAGSHDGAAAATAAGSTASTAGASGVAAADGGGAGNAAGNAGASGQPSPRDASAGNSGADAEATDAGSLDALDAAVCDPAPSEARVAVGDISLDVHTQGCGETMLMLHGFPEFWFTWDPLVPGLQTDFRLVRPNQRGYAPSDIPSAVDAYQLQHLVDDVVALIHAVTRGSDHKVILVAHDWGGIVAWAVAEQHPELLKGLVVLSAPPPGVWATEMQKEPQRTSSGYINTFVAPSSEALLSAGDYNFLAGFLLGGITTAEQTDQYKKAWATPGTLTGGLNWYRANLMSGPAPLPMFPTTDLPVTVPALLLWGDQDPYLLGDTLIPDIQRVATKLTVKRFPADGHLLMYQDPDAIVAAIKSFVTAL